MKIDPIYAAAAALVLNRQALAVYLAGDVCLLDDASREAIDREVESLNRDVVESGTNPQPR